MVRRTVWVILLMVFITACSRDTVNLDAGKFGVIYTDSLQPESEFVVFDEKGEKKSSVKLESQGIFLIEPDGNGGYILPGRFDTRMYFVDRQGRISHTQGLHITNFAKKDRDILVVAYNKDLQENILEIRQGNNIRRLKLGTLLRTVALDDRYIYIYCDEMNIEKNLVYIVDRKDGKLHKTITLKDETANAEYAEIIGDDLVLTTDRKLTLIDRKTWKVRYVDYPKEKNADPAGLLPDGDTVYVPFQDGIIAAYDKNWRLLRTIRVSQSVYRMRMDDKHFYALDQLQEKYGGVIGIYDKKTGKRKDRIYLPDDRRMLVQNFVLLDQR